SSSLVDTRALRSFPTRRSSDLPAIYQDVNGVRRAIAGDYVVLGPRRVGFQVAAYDRSRPLIIDPVLLYSTYLGGSGFEVIRGYRSEEHTSELQSRGHLVCRLLL